MSEIGKKHRCKICSRNSSEAEFGLLHGNLRSTCKPCRASQAKTRHWSKKQGKSKTVSGLFEANFHILSTLTPGTYVLRFRPNQEPTQAFLAVKMDSIYFYDGRSKAWDFYYDLRGVTEFLTNRNLMITNETATVVDMDGNEQSAEDFSRPKQNVNEVIALRNLDFKALLVEEHGIDALLEMGLKAKGLRA